MSPLIYLLPSLSTTMLTVLPFSSRAVPASVMMVLSPSISILGWMVATTSCRRTIWS